MREDEEELPRVLRAEEAVLPEVPTVPALREEVLLPGVLTASTRPVVLAAAVPVTRTPETAVRARTLPARLPEE